MAEVLHSIPEIFIKIPYRQIPLIPKFLLPYNSWSPFHISGDEEIVAKHYC
jgi:hypothetical protein